MQYPGRVCRFLKHILSLFQSKTELNMIRISVGAPMTPNKTFSCNDAKSMKGGLLLVKARG